MNTSSTSPFSLPDGAPELAQRFCMILAGLAGLVARRFIRMPHLMRFTLLLWGRLNRAVPRFMRAMARPATIRVRPVRVAKAETARAVAHRLPSRRGWLVGELGYEAVGFGLQLEHLLADPAMQAMLAERPALGRMLRPLCRMLGVSPPVVQQALAVADNVTTDVVRPATLPDCDASAGRAGSAGRLAVRPASG